MEPVRQYGEALALVTVTRSTAAPDGALATLPAATARPVQVVHVDAAGAPTPAGARRLPLREDVGRAAAVNRAVAGLDETVGWVAVVEPDLGWGPGALDTLLAAAVRFPRAGLLGPLVRGPSGGVLGSAGALPALGDALRGRMPAARDLDLATAGPVGWLAGPCLLVRRAAWDSVDGYDPRYAGGGPGLNAGLDLADVDLCDRLGRAGWLVVHEPGAEVTSGGRGRQGILEPYDRGLRRYVRDRHRGPARALVALVRRG